MTPAFRDPPVPPDRRGMFPLGDERSLAFAEWGAPDGAPVLLMPGAGMGAGLGFGAAACRRLGVRLIAVARPGTGSPPDPAKSFASVAEDVAAFCRARGLGTPPAVGFSQGAPFALALAAAGVARSIALVAPQDDLAHPAIAARLPPDVAGFVAAVRSDPAGVEAHLAATDAAALHALILATAAPTDRALYEAPPFRDLLTAALAEGFADGGAGYARDTVLALSAWPFDPAAIGAPVAIWCGGLDQSPVHSPDAGESLAARLPNARRHVVPGAGATLLWTHADAILSDLAAS